MTVDIISIAFGVIGVVYGLRCYRELWKWARQCQHARIAIAYKGRVKLQAPLVEWLLWCNMLDKDKDSNGRVVYSMGGTSIAITKAVLPPGKVRRAIRGARAKGGVASPPVREGSWSAKDQTHAKAS